MPPTKSMKLASPKAGGTCKNELHRKVRIRDLDQLSKILLGGWCDLLGAFVTPANHFDAMGSVDCDKIPTDRIGEHAMQCAQDLAGGRHRYARVPHAVSQIADGARRQLSELHRTDAMIGMQNVVLDMPLIDLEVVPGRALPTFHPAFTMLEIKVGDVLHRDLAGIGSIGAGLELAFDLKPKGVRLALGRELLSASLTCCINDVDAPSCAHLAFGGAPCSLSYARHARILRLRNCTVDERLIQLFEECLKS